MPHVIPDSLFLEIFACGIENPGLWNPEFSSRNLRTSTWNAKSATWNSETKDCLGLSLVGIE